MPCRLIKTSLLIWIIVFKQICDAIPYNQEKRYLNNKLARIIGDKSIEGENENLAVEKRKAKAHFTKEDIDKQNIDPDSKLELLLESMSGNGKKVVGIHPNEKSFITGMKLEEEHISKDHGHSTKRNFVEYIDDVSWPDTIIPYNIELDTFTDEGDKKTVQQLMLDITDDFKEKTCVKLVPKTREEIVNENLKSYVKVRRESKSSGCFSSHLGRYKYGPQTVNLGNICLNKTIVTHEFGHVLGMEHEQKRFDRDDHLIVHLDNVEINKQRNLKKSKTLDTNPYDYSSVMQYPLDLFSIKSWENTMEFRDPDLECLAASSRELTFYDAMDITKVLKCNAECTTGLVCKNGGFLNHECECYCPKGLTGKTCDAIVSNSCGGIIDLKPGSPVNITSSNYPTKYNTGTVCYWLLRAENANQRIMIQVLDFDLPMNSDFRCYHWLEVRYNLIGQRGQKFCGNKFDKNKISTTEFGNPDLMMLIFDSATVTGVDASKGFLIQVEAFELKSEGCTSKLPRIRHSSNNFKEVGSAIGAIVRYKCDEYYRMVGHNSVTCQADGSWSEKRGQCDKRDVVFECNFELETCGITFENTGTHKWGITDDTATKYFTVTPLTTTSKNEAYFTIPYSLKRNDQYCLSFSFRRTSSNSRCASLIVRDSKKIGWKYTGCNQIGEWTLFKGTYTQKKTGPFTFSAEITHADGGKFNFDIDNIVLSKGGGC